MLKDEKNLQEAQPAEAKAEERRLLFISHSNPEDNAAAAWFATQLTLLGYEVWCDVKNLYAGESSLWLKVQQKIEKDTAKFIFILSNTSRDFKKKRGVYKEVQAADNTKRDNFILPLRVERLTGSVPILISTDLYIPSENWAEGLRELHKRLVIDGVPRPGRTDSQGTASWWPAINAHDVILREDGAELVSNLFPFSAFPEKIHLLAVSADNNRLRGIEQLKGALPSFPPYAVHGDFAVSFASEVDYREPKSRYEVVDVCCLRTADFLKSGLPEFSIKQQAAQDIITYLVAKAFEAFLTNRGLSSKAIGFSRRKTWFPAHGLLRNGNYRFSERGSREKPVWFVGTVTSFGKKYFWHFAVQPLVDLHTHHGIVLSPRAIITKPYRSDRGEKPYPLDERRALKKLGWWNKHWRSKILALASWLAEGGSIIRVPTGYQQIVLSATPEVFESEFSYVDWSDDDVIRETIRSSNA